VTARPAFELADVFRRHGESYGRTPDIWDASNGV
jgi:hypothetical protein